MSDALKAVIAGCGSISKAWLNPATKMENLEIVGLADLREEAAQKRAEEFALDNAIIGTDYRDVIERANPDVVFDCTVPEAHCEVTLAALERGCHVLGEKPMSDSMENARRMVAAAKEAGKIYAVIQNRRYNAAVRRVRAFVESGELGDLTMVNSDFYLGAHFGGFRDAMKHVLLLDMAIHTFDAARFISGADPKSVCCLEWNPRGSWYEHGASAVAAFRMSDGIVYNYRGSWCSEGMNTSWESDWRIQGTHGAAQWNGGDDLRAETVAATGGFKSEMREVIPPAVEWDEADNGHSGLIREFARCVREGGEPLTACDDNIKSLAMVFGAIESAEKGGWVEIEV